MAGYPPVTAEEPVATAFIPAPDVPSSFSTQAGFATVLSLHFAHAGAPPTDDGVRELTRLDLEPDESHAKLRRLRELRDALARHDAETGRDRAELAEELRRLETERAEIESGPAADIPARLSAIQRKTEAARGRLDALAAGRQDIVRLIGAARAAAKPEAVAIVNQALAARQNTIEFRRREAMFRIASAVPDLLDELLLVTRAAAIEDQSRMAGGLNVRAVADRLLGPAGE